MKIAGLQKMTLLDYPGKVACTVFLQGCNFRCPFCHNSDLLPAAGEPFIDEDGLLAFLQKRIGLLDAVCISGGEPTLQKELPRLLGRIKEMGYLVKLDTNGYRPEVLKQLVSSGLLDYVAMDVKNSPAAYGMTVGREGFDLAPIEQSLQFLIHGQLDYELRTTVAEELHSSRSLLEMGQWLEKLAAPQKVKRLFLQPFVDRESVLQPGLHAPSREKMEQYAAILTPYAGTVTIRG